MLHLFRHPGEKIVIGDLVWVEVVSVVGNQVKLGIDAPKGIGIYRQEVWQTLQTRLGQDKFYG